MDRIPLLLVGCGMMGLRHLRGHGELHRTCPGRFDLVAVCDRDEALANAAADEAASLFGRRPAVFSDLAAAAQSGAVAADVVTPNRTHDDVVCELFAAGLHVMLEKPFAVTIARGRRILKAHAASGKVLAVAENNRRDPVNRMVRHAVQAGVIGDLRFIDEASVQPGGKVLATPWRHKLAMGGLPLDVWLHNGYMQEYFAGPMQTISAVGNLGCRQRTQPRPDGTTLTVDCEGIDTATAAIRYASGAVGCWTNHYATFGYSRGHRILTGTAGTIVAPGDRSGRPVQIHLRDGRIEGDEVLAALPDFELNDVEAQLWGGRVASYSQEGPVTDRKLIAAELADFLEAVATGREPEVPGELGLRSAAIIYALLESVHAGRPVRIDEVLRGEIDAVQRQVEAAGA